VRELPTAAPHHLLPAFTLDTVRGLAWWKVVLQSQQRNCLRFTRSSFRRLADLQCFNLAKNWAGDNAASDSAASTFFRPGHREDDTSRESSALRPGGSRPQVRRMFAAVLLLVVAVVWRVVLGVMHSEDFGWLHNFAPLSAIALCGAFCLPRRWAFALPLAALFVSDIALNLHYKAALITWEMAARYFALGGIAWLGWSLRSRRQVALVLGASVVGSIAFFVVTNTASWLTLTEPAYAKSFAGWTQAMTSGLPGFPSTLTFFRHTLISDVLFTAIFLGAIAWSRRPAISRQEAVTAH
jgi:hypothetical protein